MARTVDAIYEQGLLRPVEPLEGIPDRARVRVTVELPVAPKHPLANCIGILPDEDAEEMRRVIEDAFERVNPDEWR